VPDAAAGRSDEVRSLRRSMRDLVALSTLPAVWGDFRADQIAESLADVLVGMVDLDLLLVRVPLSPGQPPYDAVRTRTDGPYASEQVRTLADALPADPGGARTISRPDGGGALGMVAVPLGLGGDSGVLVAASEAPRFPSENDRLFLTVGANQAAMVLQRRRAEEQLQRSQRELSDFMENAVVGLHRVGPDGRILWANRAELDLLGYTSEEYIGRPVADVHADPATIEDILGRLSAREELHNYPARLRCKDGSIKHVLISSNARWEGDRFVHTRCFTRDVTEVVRAEQGRELLVRAGEVLASSLDWDATLDHVMDLAMPLLADFGFFDVVEADGRVRRIASAHEDPRRQAILDSSRWSRADHTDLNVCALTSGRTGFHPDITGAWLHAVAAGPEHLAVMRDLAFRSMVTVPLRHGERTLGALTLFFADSGRRHTEDDVALSEELARRAAMAVENARLYGEAQAAIRVRDEFLSIASHELRNPVAGMKGAAQMLRRADERGQLDGARLRRYVGMIEQTANRLATLTEDLLDVSRLQQGVLPLRPRRTDLAALIGSVIARFQEQSPAHQLALDLGCSPDPAVVDPDRIEQVLENLLGNAVKYTPGGGPIEVTMGPDQGGLLLRVRDRGIGLPEPFLERIFEPFGRASNAVERNIEGLGLGLYICRQIVEQHGGRLWAESDGEGKGTTMLLRLPASDCVTDDAASVA
jgi:PAS domain S-box-containing protein